MRTKDDVIAEMLAIVIMIALASYVGYVIIDLFGGR